LTLKEEKRFQAGALLAGLGIGYWLISMLRRQARRMDFTGKTVVITGGSRGLGLEMARLLARDGANLALLARNDSDLSAARSELMGADAHIVTIPCDVGERRQVQSAIQQVMDAYGRIDVLINNAGIIQVAPIEHQKIEDYENAMAVHFWGPLYTMTEVIPIMRRQGSGGRIVNISSIGGKVAVPHLAWMVFRTPSVLSLRAVVSWFPPSTRG
jgi:NAD(P)-dependent dehydrogenase (short-subunit alcohol dehydrogenase family)